MKSTNPNFLIQHYDFTQNQLSANFFLSRSVNNQEHESFDQIKYPFINTVNIQYMSSVK